MEKSIVYNMMDLGYDPDINLQVKGSDTSFDYKFVEPPLIVYRITIIS